jgi:hypothetical protein
VGNLPKMTSSIEAGVTEPHSLIVGRRYRLVATSDTALSDDQEQAAMLLEGNPTESDE